ncbi:DUF6397 family protein [Streptomyces sp. NPDC017086]|uniref:DUF6397 family protein n=1 Tax=Streptomyces sp. NPDC017086 TaxID=3364976 RepID=UPI003797AD2A
MSTSTFDPARTSAPVHGSTCTPSRAARELGLKPGEFDLAVRLGHIRTVPDEGGGGGRRVDRAEIDRLRAQDGFPESLLGRVRVVGTAEGSALMEIPAARFTRLARLGLIVPVKFYLNRYRAVVWLYLVEELRQFATGPENARLLKGRTPETLRGQLAAGVDLRARNWRGRHLGFLLRQAGDSWARAGAVAALLAPAEVADIVKDPHERARVNRFRPSPPGRGAPDSPAAHITEQLMTAQDGDEIDWLRSELARAVEEARDTSPAPHPAHRPNPRPATPVAHPISHLVPAPATHLAPRAAVRLVRHPAGRLIPRPAARLRPVAMRAAARPIAPMARTVTGATWETPKLSRAAASSSAPAPRSRSPLPPPEPAVLPSPESAVLPPPESAVRPAPPSARRGPEPARPAPQRPSRGLRAWLRRRSPRSTAPARG